MTRPWKFEKSIGLSTGINLAQLVSIIIVATTFYNQVNANQTRNEERFARFAEERKSQVDQMIKMQDAQTQTLVSVAALTEKMSTTSDAIKDIRDILREKK